MTREHHISGLPRPETGHRDLTRERTAADLVNREFSRDGPNPLWMTDIERHEALLNPAVVRGHRLPPVRSAVDVELNVGRRVVVVLHPLRGQQA